MFIKIYDGFFCTGFLEFSGNYSIKDSGEQAGCENQPDLDWI